MDDQEALRLLIRRKLRDGRLPHSDIGRFRGGPGNGETCDACGWTVTKVQFVMEEGVNTRKAGDAMPMRLHVPCYQIWTNEVYLARRVPTPHLRLIAEPHVTQTRSPSTSPSRSRSDSAPGRTRRRRPHERGD